MKAFKDKIVGQIFSAVQQLASDGALAAELAQSDLITEIPPKPELGDLAFPMFPFARHLKMVPSVIALEVNARLSDSGLETTAAGPYLNVKIPRAEFASHTMETIVQRADEYGMGTSLAGEKIMIEFSSPNTNKPLHLGHLRNNALGESLARILMANGAQVQKVNLVNDRGVHICKSMLAYKELSGGERPEDRARKSDHFVGDYYVKYNEMASMDPDAENRAQKMLGIWESGDKDVRELWKQMNSWAMDGIKQTYQRTGIHFDRIYRESDTYALGKENILAGLEKGVFYRDEEGTVWADLDEIKLDKKVLLRKDGTSLYITQDVGTAINRREDWPFDRLIYVVAHEQNYHFRVLFHILKKMGFEWAEKLYHLSYGMVNLPQGKMKSREGTIVDADNLLDELQDLALEEIRKKGREEELDNPGEVAEKVALAAVHYYLLQATPSKDMIFNPKDSLSFNGNTGPYLQYMGARICSIFRKFGDQLPPPGDIRWELLVEDEEWDLLKRIADYSRAVEDAGKEYNPSIMATYLYELARSFSRFYHEHPVLNCPDEHMRIARLYLAGAVGRILRSGFYLLNMPFLELM